jgi:hypothetical protein
MGNQISLLKATKLQPQRVQSINVTEPTQLASILHRRGTRTYGTTSNPQKPKLAASQQVQAAEI